MNCVICLKRVIPEFNWTYLFSIEPICYLCEECQGKLELISGETCNICGRSLAAIDPHYIQDNLCVDCRRWEKDESWQGLLTKNTSLFIYNDFLKDIIAQFKYRGDHQLAASFVPYMPKDLAENKVVVPIPLSEHRLYERGFNQAEAILYYANITFVNGLKRKHGEKQSKKTRQQRLLTENIFSIEGKDRINAQDILLVDDIYTTGTTLRHAARILKEAGALSVTSFTIAR